MKSPVAVRERADKRPRDDAEVERHEPREPPRFRQQPGVEPVAERKLPGGPFAAGGLAFQRCHAALGQAQDQRCFLHRQPVSLARHQLQHEVVARNLAFDIQLTCDKPNGRVEK